MRKWSAVALISMLLLSQTVFAEIYEDLVKKFALTYPTNSYIIGVGAVQSSGDSYKDRRRSEILARLELAKVVRTSTKGQSVDITCEGKGKLIFNDKFECQDQIVQMVEETVDEVLEGSQIIDAGEEKSKGLYYAVAVLPRKTAILKAEEGSKEAIERAREHLEKSKSAPDEVTKKEEAGKAKEELKKSLAYDGQKAAIEQVKQNADDLFKELAGEVKKVGEYQ